MLGVGMSYSSLEEVKTLTRGDARKLLNEITNDHIVNKSDYEHLLLTCPRCNTLHSRFWVRVEYDDDKVFETSFRCGKCKNELVRATLPIEKYNCNHCGKQALEESVGILWD